MSKQFDEHDAIQPNSRNLQTLIHYNRQLHNRRGPCHSCEEAGSCERGVGKKDSHLQPQQGFSNNLIQEGGRRNIRAPGGGGGGSRPIVGRAKHRSLPPLTHQN